MKITKVINNNSVVALADNGHEVILMGAGVGFQKKRNDIVSLNAVEKTYDLRDKKAKMYTQLLEQVPSEYFDISQRIMEKAEEELKTELRGQLIFALTDHIFFAVQRQKNGEKMPNLMLQDIRLLYDREFELGMYGRSLVRDTLNCILPLDEAGYIALHIVSSNVKSPGVDVNNVIVFTNGIAGIVHEVFNVSPNENSFVYNRFMAHLKFLATRIFTGQLLEAGGMEELYPLLMDRDSRLTETINRIGQFVDETFDYKLSIGEKVFLLLHIIKIVNR
ncbi:Transcription antiterminator LicT [Clostridium sp. C105KSO15]|nr:Transcription antiterminator LicT [Clostridium sp. C105KSO15]